MLEWGRTGDSSGCASSPHSTLWPAVLSTDKQQGSRGLPPKVLLVINNKHTCQVVWRERRWHHHKVGKEFHRFPLNPALPRRPCSGYPPVSITMSSWGHPASMSAVPMPVMAGSSSPAVNRLCQLNSWPPARWTACTSIPPNVLQGQKEPASNLPEEQLARSKSRWDASCADGNRRNSCPLFPPPVPL